jgi:hypothetical protein
MMSEDGTRMVCTLFTMIGGPFIMTVCHEPCVFATIVGRDIRLCVSPRYAASNHL